MGLRFANGTPVGAGGLPAASAAETAAGALSTKAVTPAALKPRLDERPVVVPTVAAMVALSAPIGSALQTLGYHAAEDGGAATYRVIATASASYDIAGTGRAFRPVLTGTIHPKQFGTVNDGTALDNVPLQACYDYAADHGIERIDGQGLLYNIGTLLPYDENRLGFAHTGAIVDSGRTLTNFRFRTANGSTNGTVACSVRMLEDGRPTFLKNIEVDGNRANLTINDTIGKGDGGCHGIHLYHPRAALAVTPVAERDFYPCGDVHLTGVSIRNVYSYGGRADYLDCTVRLTDCTFDVRGIAWLPHSTRTIVDGAKITSANHRAGKVAHPFLSEMEFNDAYSGSKRQSFEFRRVRYETTLLNTSETALFGCTWAPMQGVDFDHVIFDDCVSTTAGLLKIGAGGSSTNPTPVVLDVDRVEITNSRTGPEAVAISAPASTAPTNISVRVGVLRWADKAGPGLVRLTGLTTVDRLVLDRPVVVEEGRLVTAGGTVIGRLEVNDIASPNLGASGLLRDTSVTTTLNHVVLRGGSFAIQGSGNGLLDANIGKLEASDLTIAPNASGQHHRIAMIRNATAEVTLRNILLTGTAYRATTYALIYSTAMTGGFIHLSNVRHLTAPTEPLLNVANLPAGRVIKESVAPLYAA